MKYLLDTNICIYLLKQRPPQVARRFAECYEGEVVISAVTLAELRYGVRCCPPETRAQNEAVAHRKPVPKTNRHSRLYWK